MFVVSYRWKHGVFRLPFANEQLARAFMVRVGMA